MRQKKLSNAFTVLIVVAIIALMYLACTLDPQSFPAMLGAEKSSVLNYLAGFLAICLILAAVLRQTAYPKSEY